MLKLPPPGSRLLVAGHHDLDGVVSAAIAGAWLGEVVPGCSIEYAIVDFDLGPRWRDVWSDLVLGIRPWDSETVGPPPDAIAVLDFPAPLIGVGQIALYADHHPGSFDAETEAVYMSAKRCGCPVFCGRGGSCARLLVDMLKGVCGWVPPDPLGEAARLAHLVDTAGYATVAEALSFDSAGPASYDHWLSTRTPRAAADIARRLADGKPLAEAMVGDDATEFCSVLDEARATLAGLDTTTGRVSPTVLVLDQTLSGRILTRPIAFSEYQDPDIRYSIKLVYADETSPLILGSLGRSPWARPLPDGLMEPDLGVIAQTFGGGGGHPFAAGFRVIGETRTDAARKARAVVQGMLAYLMPLPPGHRFAVT